MMRARIYSLLLLAGLAGVSPAHAAWREASSKHFVIYSEQSPKALQQFAEGLERFDKGLRLLFNVRDEEVGRAGRVTIFVVPNMSSVRALMGRKAPPGVAGFYVDNPAFPAAFVPRGTGDSAGYGFDSQLVLQHEYAHHFLNQNFSAVFPPWFNEGFAEFVATAERQRDGSVGFGLAANHRAAGLLLESPLSVEKLIQPTPGRNADMDRFYGRSWLLCHYLMVDRARGGQMTSYIRKINAGVNGLEAARQAFGDLKKLDKDLAAYLSQIRSKMTGFRLAADMLPVGEIKVRELGPGESAIMDVRIQSKAGVDRQEAPKVALLARKTASRFPSDPAVQTALAEAEFDAGNYAEAEAAADRAIQADPKAADALTYKGAARIELAVADEKATALDWSGARRSLIAANRLDPDDPEPLTLFFMSFIRQGVQPPANAVSGALRSLELAPQDIGLRVALVQYMLRESKAADARALLLRLASSPHSEKLRNSAAEVMAALDQGGTEAALQLLRSKSIDDDAETDDKAS